MVNDRQEGVSVPQKGPAYSADWEFPTSIGIWGGSGLDRARLAIALARKIDPDPFWMHVEASAESQDRSEQGVLTSIPADHLFVFNPPELAPETGAGNIATSFVREDAATGDRFQGLADFVRLPIFTQQLFEGRSAFSPTKVLVIANSDRLQPYYPKEEGGIRPFLEALNQMGVTGIYTDSSGLQPNARDLDYLLRLRAEDSATTRAVSVTCEQGAPPGIPGLFPTGRTFAWDELIEVIGSV